MNDYLEKILSHKITQFDDEISYLEEQLNHNWQNYKERSSVESDDKLINQEAEFKILEIDRVSEKILISRRIF